MEDNFQTELQDLQKLVDSGETLDDSQQSRLTILNKWNEAEKTAMQKSKDLESALAQKEHFRTKFEEAEGKVKGKKQDAEPKLTEKTDFDLAEKSYLLANGIKKAQIQLVWDEVSKSGKSIDEILESPYFKEKLEMEASKEAIPAGTNRSGGSAVNSPEYWVAKGQYPPNTPENRELRTKVANILAKQAANKTKFSSQPIV